MTSRFKVIQQKLPVEYPVPDIFINDKNTLKLQLCLWGMSWES